MKTKVTDLLDKKNVGYRLLPHDKEVFTCEDAAKQRGVSCDEMIKSMLLVDKNKKYVLACLLAIEKVDPRKVMEIAGTERLGFATKDEIKEVLGYTMGAVPPFVFDAPVIVVFDEEVKNKEKVNISSGDPKAGIELLSKDLINLVKPKTGEISEKFKSDVIIGLEIHAELDTESKLFCSCPTEAEEPNTATCEVCLGMPGSKPVVNKKAIEYALKLCLALNCKIAPELIFSRKTYFYPDMSKNYQITQYEIPPGSEGFVEIGENRKIGLIRIHMEEDPASLVHTGSMATSPYVLVDYNRSGRPLCEIVTKPEIHSPEEARDFMKKLITILHYLKIFDSRTCIIKADVNVSVKDSGYTRIEIKNITGFKEIERALVHEIERQKKEILEGKKLVQETRAWNAETGITAFLRAKETEEDYGYIFDPDLVPVEITKQMIEKTKKELPELPSEKKRRYAEKLKINKDDAEIISSDYVLAGIFEKVIDRNANPTIAADWIRRELPRVANYNKKEVSDLLEEENFSGHFEEILELLGIKKITNQVARELLNKIADKTLYKEAKSPSDYVSKKNLSAVSDVSEIKKLCEEAIKENKKAVEDYKKGEEKSLNFLIGQVMKKSKGKASPDEVKKIIEKMV